MRPPSLAYQVTDHRKDFVSDGLHGRLRLLVKDHLTKKAHHIVRSHNKMHRRPCRMEVVQIEGFSSKIVLQFLDAVFCIWS